MWNVAFNRFSKANIIWILLLCCFCTMRSDADSTSGAEAASRIDGFIQKVRNCSGETAAYSISVVKDDQIVFSKGYGITSKDASRARPMTENSKVAIGSLTKGFTSVMVCNWLHEFNDTKIMVNTPIHSYFPKLELINEYITRQVTIEDMFSHRVSAPGLFPPLIMTFPENYTRDEMMSRMKYYPMGRHSFRERMSYNNYIYAMPAWVMEQMSDGKLWEDALEEKLLGPLNMTSSGSVTRLHDFSDFSMPFYKDKNGALVDIDSGHFKSVRPLEPSGALYSTANDMAKWMKFLLAWGKTSNGTSLVPKYVLEDIFKPRTPGSIFHVDRALPKDNITFTGQGYGLGFGLSNYRGYQMLMHTGGIVTHSSRIILFPDLKIGIFFNTNGPQAPKSQVSKAIAYFVADIMLDLKPWIDADKFCDDPLTYFPKSGEDVISEDPPRGLACVTTSTLKEFPGRYTHPFFGDIDIEVTPENNLTLKFGIYGHLKLECMSRYNNLYKGYFLEPLQYYNEAFYHTVSFTIDSDGKPSAFDILFQNGWVKFERETTYGSSSKPTASISTQLVLGMALFFFVLII